MHSRLKVEKLMNHEQSARLLGNIAEADAFAAKVDQLIADHGLQLSHFCGRSPLEYDPEQRATTASRPGMAPIKIRQEWSERLAFGCAAAFNCELFLKTGSDTVLFRGPEKGRDAAALLYSELARQAVSLCAQEFARWKQRQNSTGSAAARATRSKRWKRSFLLGYSIATCEHFICSHHCRSNCAHAGKLVRIGQATPGPVEIAPGRAIGGMDLLYDALYRGGAKARLILAELDQHSAA